MLHAANRLPASLAAPDTSASDVAHLVLAWLHANEFNGAAEALRDEIAETHIEIDEEVRMRARCAPP